MEPDSLKAALAAMNWSQRELARRLDLDPDTVNRWATGRVPVPGYAVEYLRVMRLAKEITDAS